MIAGISWNKNSASTRSISNLANFIPYFRAPGFLAVNQPFSCPSQPKEGCLSKGHGFSIGESGSKEGDSGTSERDDPVAAQAAFDAHRCEDFSLFVPAPRKE